MIVLQPRCVTSQWTCLLSLSRRRVRFVHQPASRDDGPGPRVAVIGSGPAGFYTAQKVMRKVKSTKVDMYEQLPVPFGLVRSGVAPDHPEVKNCQDTFDEVAASPNYTFIGNTNLGHDLPLHLLAKHYDAIVFAYGASKDRKIGLKGEDRPHIYSARAFVGWYNGLPEYRNLNPDLTAGEIALVVGQGNVALDVARILLSPFDHLKKTDITEYALETLASSTIRHVRVVGRRGPLQAAFTIKEVRELMNLEDVNFSPIPFELFPPELNRLPRPKRRILELLQKGSPYKPDAPKSWSLDFLLAPKSLRYSASDPSQLEGVTFSHTALKDPLSPESLIRTRWNKTTLPTSTLFRSIGYKAEPIPGMAELGADFNKRKGTLSHDGLGRIIPVGTPSQLGTDEPRPASLYCAGWVKRGPTGVIASTMADAFQTAETIVDDWRRFMTEALPQRDGWTAVKTDADRLGLKLNSVHWDQWQKIDGKEKQIGESRGKPREKFGTIQEMLEASKGSL